MDQRKIAPWIYGILVAVTAFVLGYFSGLNAPGEQIPVTVTAVAQEQPAPVAATPKSGGDSVLIDLNLASKEDLETLPGIGSVLAERILEYRKEHGRFVSKEQIMDVEGIGEVRYAELEQLITVEVAHENTGSGR